MDMSWLGIQSDVLVCEMKEEVGADSGLWTVVETGVGWLVQNQSNSVSLALVTYSWAWSS